MLSTGRSIRGRQNGRRSIVVLAAVLVVTYTLFRSGYVNAAYGYIASVQGLLPAIVGALLALLANYLLQYMRQRGEQVTSEARTRAEAENAALQTYLDRIENLLPQEPEQKLLPEALSDTPKLDLRRRQLFQARTMAMLQMLSADRKRVPLTLAFELGLLNAWYPRPPPG